GYAANLEGASAVAQPGALPAGLNAPELVQTPNATTIEALVSQLGVPAGATLKAFPVIIESDGEMRLVMVRGDHRINEIKLQNTLGQPFRAAEAGEVAQRLGPPGFIGPVGSQLPVLLDDAAAPRAYVTGANQADAHLRGVEPGRDFQFERVDVRSVAAGDTVNGATVRVERAIEVGNIFKLGTRYSDPLGASYLDEEGRSQLIWMGSYGFGPARAAAAAVEQHADEHGISWPRAVAPFDVELVVLGKQATPERELADRLYGELGQAGL